MLMMPILCWVVISEDTQAPCWRGREITTLQDWQFESDANPASPTTSNNSFGNPQATFVGAEDWYERLIGFEITKSRTGLWSLFPGGKAVLSVPNKADCTEGCTAYVTVQVTYYRDNVLYNSDVSVSLAGATKLIESKTCLETNSGIGNIGEQWVLHKTVWRVNNYGNQFGIEVIAGPSGTVLDETIVDVYLPIKDDGDRNEFRPCWRGDSASTYQSWSFHWNSRSLIPEDKNNSYGIPQASISVGTGVGWVEFASDYYIGGCRQGLWDLGVGGVITLSVPGQNGTANSIRYIRVQVLQYNDGVFYPGFADVVINGATLIRKQQQVIESIPGFFGGDWIVEETVLRLSPASASDIIEISSATGALIDQVVVDTLTIEVPWPANITASADPGACSKANVTWQLPAVDGCKITATNSSPASGSTFDVGQTTVTLSVTTAENVETHQITVTISDNEPPVAKCKDITLFLSGSGTATIGAGDVDNNSTDNCGIQSMVVAPSSFSCANVGANTVTLTVTDVNGNTAVCTATVTVKDNQAPTITAPANVTVNADNGQCYATGVTLGTPTTSDNCPGATVSNNGLTQYPVGSTTVTWTVTDASGNTAQATQTVTVLDNQAPTKIGRAHV